MAIRDKTKKLIEEAHTILSEYRPMTVRQVYYQLVSRQIVENNIGRYKAVSRALVTARKEGLILWEWIEDRLRFPRHVSMWSGLPAFAATAQAAYRRDVWDSQPDYLEVWLEKDALSGVFEEVLAPYGVTLNVGRGFDGWDSIRNAAARYQEYDYTTILYFGDFDPSGEDMARSLCERIAFFGVEPELVKCALTATDIQLYNLPPALAKKTDTRAAKFIAKHGDVSVELDALPMEVLKARLVTEVEAHMDLAALARTKEGEREDLERLVLMLGAA